jgi:hypothetical protein
MIYQMEVWKEEPLPALVADPQRLQEEQDG